MFEVPEDKEEVKKEREWIGISIVVLVLVVGIVFYVMSRHSAKGLASIAPTVKTAADPVHDLKIRRTTMNKDRAGTTAVWLVTIENESSVYTYSDIHYETAYMGADDRPLLVNQSTISVSLGPGEERSCEIRDALYPTGTSWYRFRITDAKSAIR
jgi:hypothetical protein